MTAIITAIVVWAVVVAAASMAIGYALFRAIRWAAAPAVPNGTKPADPRPGERIDTPVPARPGGGR
jgi:hypothetical protein